MKLLQLRNGGSDGLLISSSGCPACMDFAVTHGIPTSVKNDVKHGRLSMSLAHCTLTPGSFVSHRIQREVLQQAYSNVGHGRCAFNVVIDIS